MTKSFLGELKRRKVVRMAGLYLVGALLLVNIDRSNEGAY